MGRRLTDWMDGKGSAPSRNSVNLSCAVKRKGSISVTPTATPKRRGDGVLAPLSESVCRLLQNLTPTPLRFSIGMVEPQASLSMSTSTPTRAKGGPNFQNLEIDWQAVEIIFQEAYPRIRVVILSGNSETNELALQLLSTARQKGLDIEDAIISGEHVDKISQGELVNGPFIVIADSATDIGWRLASLVVNRAAMIVSPDVWKLYTGRQKVKPLFPRAGCENAAFPLLCARRKADVLFNRLTIDISEEASSTTKLLVDSWRRDPETEIGLPRIVICGLSQTEFGSAEAPSNSAEEDIMKVFTNCYEGVWSHSDFYVNAYWLYYSITTLELQAPSLFLPLPLKLIWARAKPGTILA